MSSKYASLKGKESTIRINTAYIVAYTYDDEADNTVIWFLGMPHPVSYPGDQRKEITMAIASA